MKMKEGTKTLARIMAVLMLAAAMLGPSGSASAGGAKAQRAEKQVMSMAKVDAVLNAGAQPAVQWVGAGQTPVRSKLGGMPDLPKGFNWPQWKNKPLAFVAQIDLGEVPHVDGLLELPASGMLYFFYDQERSTWGFDPKDVGSWRVMHVPKSALLTRAKPPAGLSADSIFAEKRLAPRVIKSYPSLERVDRFRGVVPDAAYDALDARLAEIYGAQPRHQIGGYPVAVQNDDMEREAQMTSKGINLAKADERDPRIHKLSPGVANWRLLLQLDTDDEAGMMWGDMGKLYFWIESDALAKGDFSRVWMVLQCY